MIRKMPGDEQTSDMILNEIDVDRLITDPRYRRAVIRCLREMRRGESGACGASFLPLAGEGAGEEFKGH